MELTLTCVIMWAVYNRINVFTILYVVHCIVYSFAICDHDCENQSFVEYNFCQTLILKCSLFHNFAYLDNKMWCTGRATVALSIF